MMNIQLRAHIGKGGEPFSTRIVQQDTGLQK